MEVCLNAPGSGTGAGNGIRLGQAARRDWEICGLQRRPRRSHQGGQFPRRLRRGHDRHRRVSPEQSHRLRQLRRAADSSGARVLAAQRSGEPTARLDLQLDEAPTVVAGVPANLGLADYNTLNAATGQPNTDYFYDITGTTALPTGTNVTFVNGKTYYTWQLKYHGTINWSDANNSQISSVTDGGGLGTDIVLIGQSWRWEASGRVAPTTGATVEAGIAGTPDSVGVIANFLSIPGSATTVTVNTGVTAGHINFENTNGYLITAPGRHARCRQRQRVRQRLQRQSYDLRNARAGRQHEAQRRRRRLGDHLRHIARPQRQPHEHGAGTASVNNIRVPVASASAGTLRVIPQANPYDVSSEAGTSKVTKLNASTGVVDLTNTKIITQDASMPTTPVYDGINDVYTYSGVHRLVQLGRGDERGTEPAVSRPARTTQRRASSRAWRSAPAPSCVALPRRRQNFSLVRRSTATAPW